MRLLRRLERLESLIVRNGNGSEPFTADELRDLATAASEAAFAFLVYRFARDGFPAHPDDYRDAVLEALGVPLEYRDGTIACSWRAYKPIPIDAHRVVELLPYLEAFLHVEGNVDWDSRMAWRLLLREHQIPETWEWYRGCQPAPKGWRPMRVGD